MRRQTLLGGQLFPAWVFLLRIVTAEPGPEYLQLVVQTRRKSLLLHSGIGV